MFADDRSIENLQQLFVEFKKYLKLQKEYTKLEITEKLSILLSALVLLSVVIILGMVALFYLSFALAYILDPLVGGLMVSFSIIAAFHLLLVLLVITPRILRRFGQGRGVGILALVALGLRLRQQRGAYHPPGFHLVGARFQICNLLAAQIRSRHRVFILCRCELRRLVGQDPDGPYGPRGEVGRRL